MTTTPAGNEPHRPGGPLAPTAPGNAPQPTLQPLTRTQKTIAAFVGTGTAFIAALGFAGSYSSVTVKAHALGFGWFANWITIGVDAGIGIFLALDLLLTWLRMPYPLLRHIAWLLTAATITFNASASWPNPLGVGMHAVIPVLFIAATEAARHAIGRIADITADKYMEGPPPSRWFLNPVSTFILWRRQRLWAIRLWGTVLELERERRIYIGKLRREHGRAWRRKATADQLLVLHLATKSGMSITEAIDLPAREEAKRRAEADRIAREAQQAEDERRRKDLEYKREQQRLEDERRRQAENDRLEAERNALALEQERQRAEAEQQRQAEEARLEAERKALALEQERAEAERQRQIAEAEAQARLEAIARQKRQAAEDEERRRREAQAAAERQQREAQAEADRRTRQEQLEHAQRVAAEQERAAEAVRRRRENEEAAARAAAEKEAATRRAAEIVQRASASPAPASRATSPASASRPATSQPANAATSPAASPAASRPAGPASATSANPASGAATSGQPANASANQTPATSASGSASDDYIQKVVDVYQLLEQQEGKAPSDARLGQALGVSRSRAQQLRTAAIEAGHTQLAKPMRLAS